MAVFLTILGIVVVFIGLQDVFHTLFHPARHGNVSDWIARGAYGGFFSGFGRNR